MKNGNSMLSYLPFFIFSAFCGGNSLKVVPAFLASLFIFVSIGYSQPSWVTRSIGDADLVAVYFLSANRGFVAGDDGFLASSTDGGKTWSKASLRTDETINEIYFRNDNNGYLVAGRLMFITRDGGRSWQETRIFRAADFAGTSPEFNSIRFANKNNGYVIGSVIKRSGSEEVVVDSLLMVTADGGDTWSRVPLPTRSELFHLHFEGDSRGWIVGDKGVILGSTDGGRSWSIQRTNVTRTLFSIDFANEKLGVAVGGGGTILRTEDGGNSWQPAASANTYTLKRVSFADDKTVWAVGHSGVILRSSNRGLTWEPQTSGTRADLYGLFMSKKFGGAVGEKGTVVTFQR